MHWQRGAKQRPLRLIVIAPTPYRKSKSKKLYYRDPAYLWTTDLRSSLKQLLQIYFDRWQIEVNHREEKTRWASAKLSLWAAISRAQTTSLGRGCLQCSVAGFPTGFRAERGEGFMPSFPSGGETPRRPSCLDLITLLPQRKCCAAAPVTLLPSGSKSPIRPWSTLLPLEKM